MTAGRRDSCLFALDEVGGAGTESGDSVLGADPEESVGTVCGRAAVVGDDGGSGAHRVD